MRDRLRNQLQATHRDEGGAVALLALAGLLITFMTALILYDAGFGVRHKFKVQIAADSGAYSQAAIKARVMNNIAYMNVVKRSMTALWGMYIGMAYQFYREARGGVLCAFAATGDVEFLRFFEGDLAGPSQGVVRDTFRNHRAEVNAACDGAADQYEVFWHEGDGDWWHLSIRDSTREGLPAFIASYENRTSPHRYWQANLQRIAWYQERLLEAAPNWASTEGSVRARASGADYVNTDVSVMPTALGSTTQMCLQNYGHLVGNSSPELTEELRANRDIHERRSDPRSKFKDGRETANLEAGMFRMGVQGCTSLETNFGDRIAPWMPTESSRQDYVSTGRKTKNISDRANHWQWLRPNQTVAGLGDKVAESEVYEGVSCGEFEDMAPQYLGFRASWVPRIAPTQKCGEPAGVWK